MNINICDSCETVKHCMDSKVKVCDRMEENKPKPVVVVNHYSNSQMRRILRSVGLNSQGHFL